MKRFFGGDFPVGKAKFRRRDGKKLLTPSFRIDIYQKKYYNILTKITKERGYKMKNGTGNGMQGEKLPVSKIFIKIGVIILGACMYVFGLRCFVSPNDFVSGGAWGIALMIEHVTGFPSDIMSIILNAPLLLLALILVGWKFTLYTILFIGVQTLSVRLFGNMIPTFTEDKLLSAIAGGVIMGTGLALCLKVGGCTGGTDIISVIIQKRNSSLNVPWIIFIINVIIIGVSFFVYGGLTPVILSIILEFVMSKISDVILNGMASAIRFEIVTNKGEEMQDAIVNKLGRGATVLDARGGYTNEAKTVLICLIHKRQISAFNRMLHEVDPHAFAYISNVSSVKGLGFSDGAD